MTSHIGRFRRSALILVAVYAVIAAPQRADAQGWDWTIAPYLWASDVGMDVKVNGDPVLDTEASFSDLFAKVDTVFMGHFEGRTNKWGAFFDVIYLDLSDGKTVPLGPGGPILGDLVIDARLKLGIYELGGLYRFGELAPGSSVVDLLFGVRQVNMDINLDITLPGPAATPLNRGLNQSETDAMFGARFSGLFTEKWHWKLRIDYSAGGTDGVFNSLGAIGYAFGQTGLFSLDVGYRYMEIKMAGDGPGGTQTESDITMSGPIVGFIFEF